jgi:hypothetical protein
VRHTDPDAEALILDALESVSAVASFAGIQSEREVLPGLLRAAFIYDAGSCHFAWWTDGDTVYRTPWFNEHCPDPERFLDRARPGEGDFGVDITLPPA